MMSLISFFSAPVLGKASDRLGRRRQFFQTGSFLSVCGLLVCLLARNSTQFLIGRLLQSVFRVSNILIQISLSENCHQEELGDRFATLSAVQAVAFVIGPVLGGQLGVLHQSAPILVSICLCVCNIFVQLHVRSENKSKRYDIHNGQSSESLKLFLCCFPHFDHTQKPKTSVQQDIALNRKSDGRSHTWITAGELQTSYCELC